MSTFTDFTDCVSEMMDEFAGTATYISSSPGVYNPATGTSAAIVQSFPVQAILMDLLLKSNGSGMRKDSLIQDGDKLLYVKPTNTITPIILAGAQLAVDASADRVIVGGLTYKIVTMKVIDTTGGSAAPIVFELYLRR